MAKLPDSYITLFCDAARILNTRRYSSMSRMDFCHKFYINVLLRRKKNEKKNEWRNRAHAHRKITAHLLNFIAFMSHFGISTKDAKDGHIKPQRRKVQLIE